MGRWSVEASLSCASAMRRAGAMVVRMRGGTKVPLPEQFSCCCESENFAESGFSLGENGVETRGSLQTYRKTALARLSMRWNMRWFKGCARVGGVVYKSLGTAGRDLPGVTRPVH
jgi:hypothetical protein